MSQEGDSSQESNARSQWKRNPAHKIRIINILSRKFTPRVNVTGAIVLKHDASSFQTLMIDDGSDKIAVRNFDNTPSFSNLDIGNAVIVIGNPREFNNEIYIAAEIIKKINPLWMKVRQLETEGSDNFHAKKPLSNSSEIVFAIRELDDGRGVPIEKILEMSSNQDAGVKIDLMLKKGELFEVSPGRIKVLE